MEYMGKQLTREPRNMSFESVIDVLLSGRTVLVQLEPGDATRYELRLGLEQSRSIKDAETTLHVARMRSDLTSSRVCVDMLDPDTIREAATSLDDAQNGHTARVFEWWLHELCEGMKSRRAAVWFTPVVLDLLERGRVGEPHE